MRFSTQQWQEFFKEQEDSGLSIAAFCRDKNIKVKNFYNNRSNHLRKTRPSAFILAKKSTVKSPDWPEVFLREVT